MNLQQTIRRILREETELPLNIKRRSNFSDISDKMKKYSLSSFKSCPTKDLLIGVSSLKTAKDILPWHDEQGNDYNDEDYKKWLTIMSEYLIENYGKETMEYFDKVLPQGSYDNDGNKYVFIKHSERNGGNGFSETYFTWADLIAERGWWFPINWWEVKEKLDKLNSGRVTFLNPGDKHNTMGYYFSIQKNKNNIP